jgi:hypothetical protein
MLIQGKKNPTKTVYQNQSPEMEGDKRLKKVADKSRIALTAVY